ncbi:DNA polymerase III subunit chi [Lichenihabitans psoromatis]|uniref:DNA polymerase III subunit chi n=1 Tax=Lichenihabitans psoromatis TaxID=2528642 RepID=UPI00103847C1|nr:DNA polymerase III subunit chi [Lichenihabitans psoromatis]
MTDVWFYHLETRTLEQVLPLLLERARARGWRAVVQAGSPERVAALDQLLWTYDETSFLPHGTLADGAPETQPVYLTDGPDNPNKAAIRLFVDGAVVAPVLAAEDAGYDRAVLMFDGRDDDAVAAARRQWSALKEAGHVVSYWQLTDSGGWEKRA